MSNIEKLSDHIEISHEAILKELGLNPRDPKAQAVVLIADRYRLDPVLKHVILVSGNVYITRAGLLHVAHASGVFDGIEVVDIDETDTHYTAKVSVYRKDMSRPITYPGRYPKDGTQARKYGPEMAVTRAEVNALRRAFDVNGVESAEFIEDAASGFSPSAAPAELAPPADDEPEPVNEETARRDRELQTEKSRLHSLTMRIADDKKGLLRKDWLKAGLPERDPVWSLDETNIEAGRNLIHQWVALSALGAAGFTTEKQRHQAVNDATGGDTESTKELSVEQLHDVVEFCDAIRSTSNDPGPAAA